MLSEPIDEGHEDHSQDEDSLFGSPPPSPPARGRSPSPSPALPHTLSAVSQALSSGSSAQNVGTIALPGSHTYSEQSVNSLATSLSLPGGSCAPVLPQSLPSSQLPSRQGSAGRNETPRLSPQPRTQPSLNPRRKPAQPRKQSAKSNSNRPSPRPLGPEIPLPDPSQPPPPHFLRNQQALLGHAGLIAGVKPAKLTTLCGTPRGASPSNPIVLKEYEGDILTEPPAIGRAHVNYLKSVDPSKLPAPTYQEIVEVLIKQKDIFPVLQNIFKLLATGALGGKAAASALAHGGNADQRQPPAKRRRLHRVPAGAADWDVPYPFQEGEGPEAYRQNWEKERGRQLISQLLGLVKIAARKAASKKYLLELKRKRGEREKRGSNKGKEKEKTPTSQQEEGAAPSVTEHPVQRADEQDQPLAEDGGSENDAQAESSLPASKSPNTAVANTQNVQNKLETAVPSTTSFDHLISSLLAAASGQSAFETHSHMAAPPPLPSLDSLQFSQLPDVSTIAFDPNLAPDGSADQALVDSWMNILRTFPLGADGLGMDGIMANNVPLGAHPPVDLASPSDGNLSSFASSADSYPSSLTSTPNPDPQPAQTFPSVDLGQIQHFKPGGTVMTFRLGDDSLPTNDASTPMDFTFDLPPVPQNAQSSTSTSIADLTPADIEGPILSKSSTPTIMQPEPTASQISFLPRLQTAGDHVIDPELLALSFPKPDVPVVPSSGPPKPTVLGVRPATNSSDARTCSPPSFTPSPMSSFDPATPSSAGWEISAPEVVAGGISQDHDLCGQDPAKEQQKVQSAVEEEQTETHMHAASSFSRSGNLGAVIGVTDDAPSNSPPPAPVPGPGIFQVLRAADLQPQAPARKLKKSEVLAKAENRRKELQAELDRVKVKLWEATVEHGALSHLIRLRGEAGKSSPADEV